MPELKQFKLPDVGEGLTEAEIVKWHVRPGDPVTVNQIIVEIETAKAVVELPEPAQGVARALLVPGGRPRRGHPDHRGGAGDAAGVRGHGAGPSGSGVSPGDEPRMTEPRGAPHVGKAAGDSSPPVTGAPGIHGSPAPNAERQAVLLRYGVKLGAATRRARKAVPAQAAHAAAHTAPAAHAPPTAHAAPTAPPAATVLTPRTVMHHEGEPGRSDIPDKQPCASWPRILAWT
jgi:pyruvate dehydrogenase E2 component (dihydrolipoamide acetyltransferase)